MTSHNPSGLGYAAILTAAALVILLALPLHAVIQAGQPFAITGPDAVTDEQPRVACGNSNFLAVYTRWTTDSTGNPNGDIYGAFVDPMAGTLQTIPIYLSLNYESSDTHPAVAYDPDNNRFLVVFEDRWLTFYSNIYMILLDSSGNELAEGFVTSGDTDDVTPDVAYVGSGTFVVVWCQQPDPQSPAQSVILASPVTYDGTALLVPEDPAVISHGASSGTAGATLPRIAAGKDNQSLVVWQRPVDTTNPDPSTWTHDIQGCIVDVTAQPVGQINTIAATTRDETLPDASYDPYDDEFLVTWQDQVGSANHDILTRVVHTGATGTFTPGPATTIAGTSRDDTHPAVTWSQNLHKFVVAWEATVSPTNHDLYVCQVQPNGTAGSESAIASDSAMQSYPAVACGLNTSMFVWENQVIGVANPDIHGEFISDAVSSPHIVAVTPALVTELTKTAVLDTITLVLDRAVQVAAGDISVVGRQHGARNDFTLHYDSSQFRITLTWTTPLANDAYVLTVKDTVRGMGNQPLDGDVSLYAPLLPSGNGSAGGDFVGLIYRLSGDVNVDGYINVEDLQLLVAAWGSSSTTSGRWNPDIDLNDDGYVNVGDLQILVANWGQSIQKGP